MKTRATLLLPVVLLAACGAGESPSAKGNAARDAAREAVTQRVTEYKTAVLAGDTAMYAFYTPEAVLYEPQMRMTLADYRGMMAAILGGNTISQLEIYSSERAAHDGGNVVYDFFAFAQGLTPKAGGEAKNSYSVGVAQWLKGEDGVYRMNRFFATPRSPDAATMTAMKDATPAELSDPDSAAAPGAVRSAMDAYMAAVMLGNVGEAMSYISRDAQIYDAGVEYPEYAKIQQGLTDAFAKYTFSGNRVTTEDLFLHDGSQVAYQWGFYTETMTEIATGKETEVKNYFVARWEKGQDGKWTMDRFYATPQ